MSKSQTLKAEPRQRAGSGVLKQMRREGYVPSVIYGGGHENAKVKVVEKAFTDLLAHSASENIIVDLQIEGEGSQLAFLQDVQHDALTGRVLHIDFLAVNQDTEITAALPVELIGDAPGIKAGGVLEQQLHTIEVNCLPKDLPEQLEADIEKLEIGDALHVGEVTWPAGVKPLLADDVVVALINKPRTEAEEAEDEAAAAPVAEGEATPEEGAPVEED